MPRGKADKKTVAAKPRVAATSKAKKVPAELMEKPTQLKIGKAYDTSLLTRSHYSPTVPAPRPAKPGISITVQVPSLRRPKNSAVHPLLSKPSLRRRLLRPVVVIPVIVLLVAGAGLSAVKYHSLHAKTVAVASGPKRTQPDYQPLMPAATQTTARSYEGAKDIVSYTTNFSDARVTVSEQPLPANFKTDPDALTKAAESISAKQRISTNHGSIYVANSTNDNSQMAIYAGTNVLVFIHTDTKLDEVSWVNFIQLLQAKSWNVQSQ